MSQTSPCPNCGAVHPFGNVNCPKAEMRTFPAPAPEVETRPAKPRSELTADGYRLRLLDATIWNYLGLRDPVKVGEWIASAVEELYRARAASSAPAEPRSKLTEKALRLAVRVLHDARVQDDNDLHMLAADVEALANDRLASAPAETTRDEADILSVCDADGDWWDVEKSTSTNGVAIKRSDADDFAAVFRRDQALEFCDAIRRVLGLEALRAASPSPGRSAGEERRMSGRPFYAMRCEVDVLGLRCAFRVSHAGNHLGRCDECGAISSSGDAAVHKACAGHTHLDGPPIKKQNGSHEFDVISVSAPMTEPLVVESSRASSPGVESAEPTKDVLKLRDSDTGESTLDVVAVPEGFSLQMAYVKETGMEIPGGYISVIVSPSDAVRLAVMLNGTRPVAGHPAAAPAAGIVEEEDGETEMPKISAAEYAALIAGGRYIANFGDQRKGIVEVVLPLGDPEAIERLTHDVMGFAFGMGAAPHSAALLAWHELADAARDAIREHVKILVARASGVPAAATAEPPKGEEKAGVYSGGGHRPSTEVGGASAAPADPASPSVLGDGFAADVERGRVAEAAMRCNFVERDLPESGDGFDVLRQLSEIARRRREQYRHPGTDEPWHLRLDESVSHFTLRHADALNALLSEYEAQRRHIEVLEETERLAFANRLAEVTWLRTALEAAEATLVTSCADADGRFANHTKAVGAFLSEMYATMIDPLGSEEMKVEETCAALLAAARTQREELARLPAAEADTRQRIGLCENRNKTLRAEIGNLHQRLIDEQHLRQLSANDTQNDTRYLNAFLKRYNDAFHGAEVVTRATIAMWPEFIAMGQSKARATDAIDDEKPRYAGGNGRAAASQGASGTEETHDAD